MKYYYQDKHGNYFIYNHKLEDIEILSRELTIINEEDYQQHLQSLFNVLINIA